MLIFVKSLCFLQIYLINKQISKFSYIFYGKIPKLLSLINIHLPNLMHKNMKKYWQSFYLLLFAFLGTSCVTNAQEQSRLGQNLDSSQGNDVMLTSNFSPNQNKPVNWEAKLDNKYFVPNGNKKEIYVYVELQGGENKQDKARAPLNLSLVVDRSGSMSGDKLKYAKQAMDFVIDQLGSEDYLSMVQYDSDVQVLQTSEMVQDKRALHQKVDKIRDGGSTNLCGGMQEGYVQVRSYKREIQMRI